MVSESTLTFIVVGVAAVLMMRRYRAFRLRTDFWGFLAAILVLPVAGMQIAWPAAPESLTPLAMVPAYLAVQIALFLATLQEADKLRNLRRDVARWRLLTGTAPKDYRAERAGSPLRTPQFNGKSVATAGVAVAAVTAYTVAFFGWGALAGLSAFFWAFMALYQFSFSPDNR